MASLIVRIVWFIFVGWWLALLWVMIAIVACVTIIGLPLGLWMFSKTWKIASLAEDPTKIIQQVPQQIQQVTVVNNSEKYSAKESPLILLERKYAEGDITREDFLERKKTLDGGDKKRNKSKQRNGDEKK